MTHLNYTDFIQNPKKYTGWWLSLIVMTFVLMYLSYMFVDQPMAYFFAQEENYIYWKMAREITNIGLAEHYFIFSLAMIVYLKFFKPAGFLIRKDPLYPVWLYKWAWNFFLALLGSGLILRFFKFLIGRKRPHVAPLFDPHVFNPMNLSWDYQSLPSGHAQVLFTVAFLLTLLKPRGQWLWLSLATLFSLTRAITYSHFLSDVLAGALCGFLGSVLTLSLFNRYSRFKL